MKIGHQERLFTPHFESPFVGKRAAVIESGGHKKYFGLIRAHTESGHFTVCPEESRGGARLLSTNEGNDRVIPETFEEFELLTRPQTKNHTQDQEVLFL